MLRSLSHSIAWLAVASIVLFSITLLVWDAPLLYMQSFIGDNLIVSSFVFVLVLIAATVFAPVTVMPIIPATAVILGPFLTGLLSLIGWTIGGVIAFSIARYCGRPVLLRFVSLESVKKYEMLIPENTQFVTIVLLRMVVPVDVLSYAIGLTLSIPLWKYTLATLIGVGWFSFAFAYLGDAFYTNNLQMLVILGSVSLAILLVGWYVLVRNRLGDH